MISKVSKTWCVFSNAEHKNSSFRDETSENKAKDIKSIMQQLIAISGMYPFTLYTKHLMYVQQQF
jgi:hypothetical protein